MVTSYEIKPRRSIGPVRLGMARADVRVAMGGEPERSLRKFEGDRYETDGYHNGAFQIFYDGESPAVNYVELTSIVGDVDAVLRGVHVFQTKASELVAFVSEYARYDEDDPELGFSYIFPSLDISLWRPRCQRTTRTASSSKLSVSVSRAITLNAVPDRMADLSAERKARAENATGPILENWRKRANGTESLLPT